ncbi:hypothetical protein BUALT_Bualt08G0148000 [Buddleja alternifolia]|uniref:PPM-type phosphatase domain-containing protein n=1 Tax=Buddleja alternifolia TaxID=168488 RepID=A0AAV6XEM3_9LAMI|nr:hypothetical protein BUALT_Bualt08G0148000 [Buddleja alternifolia]
MLDVVPFFLRVSIITIAEYFIRLLNKVASMALLIAPPPTPPSPPSPPWWLRHMPAKEESSCQLPEISNRSQGPSSNDKRRENLKFLQGGNDFSPIIKKPAAEDQLKLSRKRPARLVVPTCCAGLDLVENEKKMDYVKEFEVIKGRDFVLASKKGRREVMEDRHAVVLDISGDPKQAFFAVIDGHGGHAAADYVAENLGRNVVNELQGKQVEAALRRGYSATDKHFLAQGMNGGACAAGVLLKDGELHVANVGDCRVVLSWKGKAITLTNDHRLSREDERARIENSGGFLHNHNGVWRVNGSIAVSRAFGDAHLKDWIICEPEIVNLSLTSECEFLIMASDGLWDKVSDQEAVGVVTGEMNMVECCKKLVEISSSRGNRDDITVMIIKLHNFNIHVERRGTMLHSD